MRTLPTHHLKIGDIIISEADSIVSTVLGSCVSVCIFSKKHKAGAINHFALPFFDNGKTLSHKGDDFRYGDQSIPYMISEFLKITGAKVSDLQAKVIGGASVLLKNEASKSVGPSNIAMAKKILKDASIPVVGEDIGGTHGRKVLFHSATGRVQVANIDESKVQPHQIGNQKAKIPRVLIVDDSKTIRDLLKRVLSEGAELEVVGFAENPLVAEKLIHDLKPDVVTLDIHMPVMDGITFLEKFLPKNPLPFVLITSISLDEGGKVLRGLELGAVDYIQKPTLQTLPMIAPLIREKVKQAAAAKVRTNSQAVSFSSKLTGRSLNPNLILAIGASTGGTEAIKNVLVRLPEGIPPTVIVQHIPAVFSKAFADRLNNLCKFKVKEAEDGDLLEWGKALIAPGGFQMALAEREGKFRVKITDGPPVNRHKPSVDFLFDSVAHLVGRKAVGVILTGMGADGAKGLLKMRDAGARTIGQDEASCVVYGMPKAAFEIGAVENVCSLDDIPEAIIKFLTLYKAA